MDLWRPSQGWSRKMQISSAIRNWYCLAQMEKNARIQISAWTVVRLLLLLNNEKLKQLTFCMEKDYTVQDGEESCRFHRLLETVLFKQIWDCPVHDGEEMCRFQLLSETVLLRQIWDCPVQELEESCRFHLLSETSFVQADLLLHSLRWRRRQGF